MLGAPGERQGELAMRHWTMVDRHVPPDVGHVRRLRLEIERLKARLGLDP